MRFLFSKFLSFYKIISKKSYSTHAGSIAFFLIINGGSIAYLTLLLSQILNIDIPINNPEILSFLNTIRKNTVKSNSFYSLFFIAVSVFSSSSLFFHLIKIGEMIYEEEYGRFSIIKRISSIIFLLCFLFILEISFIFLFLSKSIFSNVIWNVIRYIIFLFLPFFVAVCINFFITPHRVKIKEIIKGSIFTTFFWYIVTIGFTIFINIFTNYKAIYGVLTVFIIFMMWLYLLSQGLVIGMIINQNEKIVNLLVIEKAKNNIGTPEEEYEKI